MVSATSPDVTRMVMASGSNKWASRAVVILQLAAWSAVGIVLLQKGVTSLQKRPSGTRNITQNVLAKSAGIYHHSDQKDLLVIPIFDKRKDEHESKKTSSSFDDDIHDGALGNTEFLNDEQSLAIDQHNTNGETREDNDNEDIDEPRVMESIEDMMKQNWNDEFSKEEQLGKKLRTPKKTAKTQSETINRNKDVDTFSPRPDDSKELLLPIKSINNKILSNLSVDIEGSQRQFTKTEEIPSSQNVQESINSKQTSDNYTSNNDDDDDDDKITPSPAITTKSGSNWETRRRLRLSHLSGGGAAAAVAMVAVGAVMLVLGPAVIVLRALDERRQERRFLKLSGRDDLPPSYEQATLMDEAPRYSSLSLNTILGPPPPPSPTPARVHLV